MEKNKSTKILGILLAIAVVVIGVMTFFIYRLSTEKAEEKEKVANSNNQVANLEGTVGELQGKIDAIANIINSDNNTTYNVNQTNPENVNEEKITEKQVSQAAGYKIILYSNNDVKMIFNENDMNTIFGRDIDITNKECIVTGINGKVAKFYQDNNGTGVSPITFFIMENGTVSYIMPCEKIIDYNYKIPATLNINGTIENLKDVVDMKTSDKGVVIAITRDGQEIKCWNEWMENM